MMTALSGFILILGVFSCTPNELPAATSAGFVNPQASATPLEIPLNPASTIAPSSTKSPTATEPAATSTSDLPTPAPLTLDSCLTQPGQIESQQIDSEYLKKPLEYLIYLPPCYAAHTDQRYPVLYLIHGQTYSNAHWLDLGAAEIADRLIAQGDLAPFIVVFPYDRDHYISPSKNGFGQALVSDLIPAIDQDYRTLPKRAFRALGGISRGGNWAVHLGLQYPDLFGAIGAHSTPVFSVDTNPEIIGWLRAVPVDDLPRLFVDTGKNDRWLNYTLIFAQILNDENIPHEWHLYSGFHDDVYWQTHIEEYLRWYAQDW